MQRESIAPQIGPGSRDWQTLYNVAFRRFKRLGLDDDLARDEAEHFAYSSAETLTRLLEEAS